MKLVDLIASILLIIGGLNWGLVGLFDYNIVAHLVGGTGIDSIIYIAVGVAAVWHAIGLKKCCDHGSCGSDK
ncbi:MAG: DUF378 domain-containing protein [Chlamydiota bacterium]|nr:DUF378 domain-containing protein [Chlamydiota bacterium]